MFPQGFRVGVHQQRYTSRSIKYQTQNRQDRIQQL